jgi:hypothetical protein
MPWNSHKLEKESGLEGKAEVAMSVATFAMIFPKDA